MWKLVLMIVCLNAVLHGVTASDFLPAVCDGGHSANFRMKIPAKDKITVITNASKIELMTVAGEKGIDVVSAYKPRITDARYANGTLEFSLSNVTQHDAGSYLCIEGAGITGPNISNCGQTLYCLVAPSVTVKTNSSKVHIGDIVTLTCEVKSASPPVSFSWTFFPTGSSEARQLQDTGDTLTLGPVAMEDSGRYTCQARNHRDLDPGEASVNMTVLDKESEAPHIFLTIGLPVICVVVVAAVCLGVAWRQGKLPWRRCCRKRNAPYPTGEPLEQRGWIEAPSAPSGPTGTTGI